MDQYLVDYTVRNITTGDEEDIRVLELTDEETDGFPDAVRDEIRSLIAYSVDGRSGVDSTRWDTAQEQILQLLLPYISDRARYDADYGVWEENVLEELCTFTMPDGLPCAQPGYPLCAEHAPDLCPDCGARGEHDYDCPRVTS